MKPSEKSFEIEAFLTNLTGKNRAVVITGNKCMTCDGDAINFKDDISRKEYSISGLCQKCQDETFK